MVDAWDDKYFNKLRHKLADDDDADWFGRAV
jgi:hypothetical protein